MVLCRSVGIELSFYAALMLRVFTALANLFTITPNNIGVQEIVMAYLFTVLGVDFSTGLFGASLLRVVHILLTFGLGSILIYVMISRHDLRWKDIRP